jgi:hypothetical protein
MLGHRGLTLGVDSDYMFGPEGKNLKIHCAGTFIAFESRLPMEGFVLQVITSKLVISIAHKQHMLTEPAA